MLMSSNFFRSMEVRLARKKSFQMSYMFRFVRFSWCWLESTLNFSEKKKNKTVISLYARFQLATRIIR